MKRTKLLQHLQRHGCVLKREGGSHSIWRNPQTNEIQAIPRHTEIAQNLARKYAGNCRCLNPDAIRKKKSSISV